MTVIGEATVVLRPDTLGFGTAARKGVDSELAGTDILGSVGQSAALNSGLVERDFAAAGTKIGDDMEKGTTRISRLFESLGSSAASLGLPFSGALTKVGQKIDDTDTKGKKFLQTLSTVGGTAVAVGAVGLAAVAAESVHMAQGLQVADTQIAAHENISVKAADNIGKAFTNTAGTVPYSANALAESFAPVSGELDQVNKKALTTSQTLTFMSETGKLAEASGDGLSAATSTVGKTMQAFQIPLKSVTGLTNDLYNTSRITGVGVDTLGSTIDKLKSRLGIAAPSVGDLSSLLVDLNEHGIQGSRGLLVVNSAVTKLLSSVPAVSVAAAKAANSLSDQLANASLSTASASTKLSQAQTDASTSVANANQKLVDVQDEIAASNTASAPTTAQQVSLQEAQTAVTNAQTSASQKVLTAQQSLNSAQTKAGQINATAAVNANQQVLAMQKLGLQVYTASGKFVGMRDVIAQLAPKLATMTQEQQLATTSQIFGASASKALLNTILAGPSAYDKAANAVLHSSTAQSGAAKQAQSMSRELDVVKASLVDEGDKLGLFLIPKLQDLAKWTAEDVTWMEKHKVVAEALGVALGGVVAVAVATFSINMGVKLVGSVVKAGQSVTNFASTTIEKLRGVTTQVEDTTEVERTSSQQFQTAAEQISDAIDLASRNIVYALGQVDATLEELVTTISTSADKIDGSFTGISSSAETSITTTETAMDGLVTSTTESGLAIIESNQKVAASYSEVGAAAVSGGEEAGGAEAGLAAKGAAGAEGAEAGAAGAGEAGAGIGASGAMSAAIAGLVSFTATTALLKSNFLGVGSAVTSAASHIANIFGVGPAAQAFTGKNLTSADVPYLQQIVAGQVKHAPLTKAEAQEALRTLHAPSTAGGSAAVESTAISSKLTTVAQLQQAAYVTAVSTGAHSAATKAALQSLYSTESKFLPQVSKDESTKAVSSQLVSTYSALVALKSQQSKLATEGTSAQTTKNIATLKEQLQDQEKAGASEQTLKDTKTQIQQQEAHLAQLNSVASKISRDQTTITKADQTKAAIEQVNAQMQQLRQEIATNPPPKVSSKMTGKLQVTAK